MKILAALSFALAISSSSGSAEELGNIFGTEEGQAESRSASAIALEGLESAIRALRLRELRESSGADELAEASVAIFTASDRMRGLVASDAFPNFEFSEEELRLIELRLGPALQRYDGAFSNARVMSELFVAFIQIGDNLAFALKTASTADGQAALPYFSELLSDYIVAGNLVSELSRSRLPR